MEKCFWYKNCVFFNFVRIFPPLSLKRHNDSTLLSVRKSPSLKIYPISRAIYFQVCAPVQFPSSKNLEGWNYLKMLCASLCSLVDENMVPGKTGLIWNLIPKINAWQFFSLEQIYNKPNHWQCYLRVS